jgi:hypothetical protein
MQHHINFNITLKKNKPVKIKETQKKGNLIKKNKKTIQLKNCKSKSDEKLERTSYFND